MKFTAAAVITILFFCPYFARADTEPIYSCALGQAIPDTRGWKALNTSRVELVISDNATAYLGLETDYNNPADPKEFVRVISRHIPLIVVKRRPSDERLLSETIVTFYTQKEERDRLAQVSKESDPIIYIKWRTKENVGGRKDILDDGFSVWFLSHDGNCFFTKDLEIEVEFMTENVGNGKAHNVFSGMKYKIDSAYHIIRVSRDDLVKLLGEGK